MDLTKNTNMNDFIITTAKGGVMGLAIWILWGAYDQKNTKILESYEKIRIEDKINTDKRIESLEYRLHDCLGEKNDKIYSVMTEVKDYITKKINHVDNN